MLSIIVAIIIFTCTAAVTGDCQFSCSKCDRHVISHATRIKKILPRVNSCTVNLRMAETE